MLCTNMGRRRAKIPFHFWCHCSSRRNKQSPTQVLWSATVSFIEVMWTTLGIYYSSNLLIADLSSDSQLYLKPNTVDNMRNYAFIFYLEACLYSTFESSRQLLYFSRLKFDFHGQNHFHQHVGELCSPFIANESSHIIAIHVQLISKMKRAMLAEWH